MPSDPTTKDLISAAREDAAKRAVSGMLFIRLQQHVDALADRLEEVGEERAEDNSKLAAMLHRMSDARELRPEERHALRESAWRLHYRKHNRQLAERMYEDPGPDTSREDPDPDTNDVPTRAESVEPEPSDPEPPLKGTGPLSTYVGEMRKWAKSEDPEPEDDPDDLWESVELRAKAGRFEARALVDLRKRVEENDDRAYQAVRQNDRKIDAMRKGFRDVWDRLTTLEGHADRGAEAEAELSGRVGRLEDKERSALRARATLRDDLEKIDDATEALAERVETLEAGLSELADGEGV